MATTTSRRIRIAISVLLATTIVNVTAFSATVQAAESTTAPAGSTGADTLHATAPTDSNPFYVPGTNNVLLPSEAGQYIPIPPLDSGNQDFSGGVKPQPNSSKVP